MPTSPPTEPRPRRVAIACQGGGSHTAFTAGVLKTLLRAEPRVGYSICALSGTSGGAICAALAWVGLLKIAQGAWDRERAVAPLDAFWRDNAANLPWEQVWNDWTVGLVRLHMQGRLPALKSSPYAPEVRAMAEGLKRLTPRPEFFDLRALLAKHLPLHEVTQPVDDPRLLIGAVAVLAGTFKAFDSRNAEISLDAVLASTTLPTLFPGVRIGDEVYWDGLLSQNPPVRELISGIPVEQKPDELWIVRINPRSLDTEPTTVEEIEDRRNILAGNLSLTHELDVISKVNDWLIDGTIVTAKLRPIAIHWIEMSPALSERLGYVSKLNRDPAFLAGLIADGEAQAEAFLAQRAATVAAS
ncbi:MAG: patatin-like phospholipase family protein [Chloroflexi bacterium]|nr:patatin-like phospholipase family protein [Chloroflexota bacterium]